MYGAGAAATRGGGGGGQAEERSGRQMTGHEYRAETDQRTMNIVVNLGGREVGRAIYEALEGYQDDRNPNAPDWPMFKDRRM